jgi:hypothetical protein
VLEKKSVVTREDFVKAFMHGKLDITLFEDAIPDHDATEEEFDGFGDDFDAGVEDVEDELDE